MKSTLKLIFKDKETMKGFSLSLGKFIKTGYKGWNEVEWYPRKNILYINTLGYCYIHNFIDAVQYKYHFEIIKL